MKTKIFLFIQIISILLVSCSDSKSSDKINFFEDSISKKTLSILRSKIINPELSKLDSIYQRVKIGKGNIMDMIKFTNTNLKQLDVINKNDYKENVDLLYSLILFNYYNFELKSSFLVQTVSANLSANSRIKKGDQYYATINMIGYFEPTRYSFKTLRLNDKDVLRQIDKSDLGYSFKTQHYNNGLNKLQGQLSSIGNNGDTMELDFIQEFTVE